MATLDQIIFSLVLFELVLFPVTASAFTIPNIKNPVTDLLPNLGGTSPGGGTGQGPTSDTISHTTSQIQSCVLGGGTGALIGGIAGFAFFGIGAIPGAILGGIAGGAVGCSIAGVFFPSQGSAVFTSLASNLGPLGDFMKVFAAALSYVGPLLSFFFDSMSYELAILQVAPEIGVFLAPLQAITVVMFFWTIAKYIRGTGMLG